MKKITLFLLLGFYCLFNINSEDVLVLDLHTAVQLAQTNSIKIKRDKLYLEDSKMSKDRSYNLFYPSLTGSTNWSLDKDADEGNLYLNLSLDLDIYQNFNKIAVLKKEYELGEIHYLEALKYVEDKVTLILYHALNIEHIITIYEDGLSIAEERFNNTQRDYETGKTSRLGLLKSQASFQKLKPTVLEYKNMYSTYLINIKKLPIKKY